MIKVVDRMVPEPLELMETYASIASRTMPKGKAVMVESPKALSTNAIVKEVDQKLFDFMIEMYEAQWQSWHQLNQIVELLWGDAKINKVLY